MEVSKAFQADIRHIQNQLKIAILNHQVMVKKKNEDPTNIHVQVQLRDVQRHIISLGEIQKQLVQRLRKELETNTVNEKVTNGSSENDNDIEIIETNSRSNSSSTSHAKNSRNNIITISEARSKKQNRIVITGLKEKLRNGAAEEIRIPGVVSTCSGNASKDYQHARKSFTEAVTHEKISFLQAVGLITHEILSDLQNRRVERKRRSTANHTQFVYGSNWDVSKRKKSGYLLTAVSPQEKTRKKTQTYQKQQQHHQQQKDKLQTFPEIDPVMPLISTVEKPLAVSSSSATPSCLNRPDSTDNTGTSAFRISPKQTSRSLLRPSSGASLPKTSLRLAGLPASLTIERINSPPHVCIICNSSGMLSTCKSCNANFHPSCSKEASCCPKCNTDQGRSYIETNQGLNESANGLIIQQTTVPPQSNFSGPSFTKRGSTSIRRGPTKQNTGDQ